MGPWSYMAVWLTYRLYVLYVPIRRWPCEGTETQGEAHVRVRADIRVTEKKPSNARDGHKFTRKGGTWNGFSLTVLREDSAY